MLGILPLSSYMIVSASSSDVMNGRRANEAALRRFRLPGGGGGIWNTKPRKRFG